MSNRFRTSGSLVHFMVALAAVLFWTPAMAAPKISVSPDSFPLIELPGRSSAVLGITISNLDDRTPLSWSIYEVKAGADTGFAWVTEFPASGTVAPGATSDVGIGIKTDRRAGSYSMEIRIDSNDPLRPQVVIPLTVEVVVATSVRRITLGELKRRYR